MIKDREAFDALIAVGYTGGGIGLAFYAARVLIEREHGSLRKFVVGAVEAALVGVAVMWALEGMSLTVGVKGFICGVFSYCAPDVLRAIRLVFAGIASDPVAWVARVRSAWSGKQ